MTEAKSNANRPFLYILLLSPVMAGVGYWAGSEIAAGEFSTQKLEAISAQTKIVRAKHDVPPQTVLTAEDLEEIEVFANRTVGGELTSLSQGLGKKNTFGLCEGQTVVLRDVK